MKIHSFKHSEDLNEILKRPTLDFSKIEKIVQPILEKVKRGGDKSLRKFALEYDHVELNELWVTETELSNAALHVSEELKTAIQQAKENIWRFHAGQKHTTLDMEVMPGVKCYRKAVPIQRVGLYVPGGTAPLFSTVLMLGIPALIAGCKEIIISSPTNQVGQINPVVLYTAHLLGIHRILKLGGAQAIAAMAYGTQSVPKVDKIFGPGNQYVTMAKQLVSRDQVAIDMPAGPSEVMVVLDETSNSEFAAADLLSQAEHGVDSQVVLVTQTLEKANEVIDAVYRQLEKLPRKDLARQSLANSTAIIASDTHDILDIINVYAPEHLIINMKNPMEVVDHVFNAGSVFIGPYTPESAGDYASGTNHTLPTNGWARSYSGVSLDSFVKQITYQEITEKGIQLLGPHIEAMAAAEQLDGHKAAVTIRLNSLKNG